jgi:hypothetical protein
MTMLVVTKRFWFSFPLSWLGMPLLASLRSWSSLVPKTQRISLKLLSQLATMKRTLTLAAKKVPRKLPKTSLLPSPKLNPLKMEKWAKEVLLEVKLPLPYTKLPSLRRKKLKRRLSSVDTLTTPSLKRTIRLDKLVRNTLLLKRWKTLSSRPRELESKPTLSQLVYSTERERLSLTAISRKLGCKTPRDFLSSVKVRTTCPQFT